MNYTEGSSQAEHSLQAAITVPFKIMTSIKALPCNWEGTFCQGRRDLRHPIHTPQAPESHADGRWPAAGDVPVEEGY